MRRPRVQGDKKEVMGFVTYDLVFLALFVIGVFVFIYTRKHNLSRQGIMYLYRTQLGIKFIDTFTKKFRKILIPAQYIVLLSGYTLMISVIWLFGKSVYLYFATPIASIIRAPPIAPLIPYFPKLFGLESFFPPLYFTYFIIALAIVAVTHEFSHGIFARLHNFKIHATGFAFLGPILGAFVEPDEKQMAKAKKFPQLVVLAAGTFANVLMTILFGAVLFLFFTTLFVPAGVKFNSYSFSEINLDSISEVGNEIVFENYVPITVDGKTYFANQEALKTAQNEGVETMIVYDDAPAFNAQLTGAITEIDGEEINGYADLAETLKQYSPGDEVTIKTALSSPGQGSVSETKEYEITFDERDGRAYLGILFFPPNNEGVVGFVYEHTFQKMKDPLTHYESTIGDFGWFIYYLLWWIVMINILVALFNMLPLGILDGGRFFYLTIWGITRSEKFARKSFKVMTWLIVAMLALLMVKWAAAFF